MDLQSDYNAAMTKSKTRCNDFSIGIELEGSDDLPYDDWGYLKGMLA